MNKDMIYRIELDNSGDIVSAGCGCPAGVKPHGSCKHILALSMPWKSTAELSVAQLMRISTAGVESTL